MHPRAGHRSSSSTLLVVASACVACSTEPAPLGQATQGLHGIEGMFDYAIDLPWRMEPRPQPGGALLYDKVPLTLAILDEDTNVYSQVVGTPTFEISPQRLGEFCGLSVATIDGDGERMSQVFHAPTELDWIETTGPDRGDPDRPAYWPFASTTTPLRRLCRPAVDDCTDLLQVRGSSEWHAQLMLDLGSTPGQRNLELIMWVSRDEATCAKDPEAWLALRNYARLTYAEAPLPRFDDGWLYGDLHYHSQSTDNEGESGYAYRAVATTLAAMGVDFVFATDHASDSEQIVDADIAIDSETMRGLRDLSQPRWDVAQQLLHGADGANRAGAEFAAGHLRLPRVFLGGEVDVMPEVPARPGDAADPAWAVPYGNGLSWDLRGTDALCEDWISTPGHRCPIDDFFRPFTDVDGATAYVVSDSQGLSGFAVGRQHLVHLPRYRDQATGFVGSRTGHYGGARRHLLEGGGVLDEIAAKQGLAFLAHPLAKGGGGKGPGMLPYTPYQYEKIFAHEALVGLQLWNEDSRVSSSKGDFGQTGYQFLCVWCDWSLSEDGDLLDGYLSGGFTFTPVDGLGSWVWTKEESPASGLHHGTAQWDRLLRWGLDLARTSQIGWLEPGEPRRLFMAGGSDAHGDFNYRREGYMIGPDKTTDTAIAKVRNLVEVGAPRGACRAADGKCGALDPADPGHSQDQVAEALGEGRFAVTDGPALRVLVDRDRDGQIDPTDYPMGATIELYAGEELPLLIEARSTGEFGPLDRIDLYVGVDTDPFEVCTGTSCSSDPAELRARTYAPDDHGVRGLHRDNVTHELLADTPAASCGAGVCQMADGYWMPRAEVRSKLRATAAELVDGVWRVSLNLNDFPTGGQLTRATRVYVRAFVRTTAPCAALTPTGKYRAGCAARYAYSNPVWTLRRPLATGAECPYSDRALDRDFDGVPDLCDAFPDTPTGTSWTRALGGTGEDLATATAVDASNQVYAVGAVRAVARFEGASGALGSHTAADQDGVVLKYSPSGQLLARLVVGGAGTQLVSDVAIDGTSLVITGSSLGSTRVGGFEWTSTSYDPFVVRLHQADLGVEWARTMAGGGRADARAVAAGGGQIVVVGDFSGTLSDLLAGLPAQGVSDCFTAFYAPLTGQLQSVQLATGAGGCVAGDVVVDATGRATASFDHTGAVTVALALPSRTTYGTDAAVVRYAALAGAFAPQWVTYVGSAYKTSGAGDAWVRALALGPTGEVRVGGTFTGDLYLVPTGAGSSWVGRSAGGSDGMIAMLDGLGRSTGQGLTLAGPGAESIDGLGIDGSGRIAAAATMTSASAVLGNALASTTVTRTTTGAAYLLAWIGPGRAFAVRQMGSTGLVTWRRMALAPGGDRAALSAQFWASARFDDRRTVTSAGGNDGAVVLLPAPTP